MHGQTDIVCVLHEEAGTLHCPLGDDTLEGQVPAGQGWRLPLRLEHLRACRSCNLGRPSGAADQLTLVRARSQPLDPVSRSPDGRVHVAFLIPVHLEGGLAVVPELLLLLHVAHKVVLGVELAARDVEEHEATLLCEGRREVESRS